VLPVSTRVSAVTARQRVVVFGAGEAGASIVAQLRRTATSPYVPVALLDDDPHKRRLQISGVRVQGTRHDLARTAIRLDADTLLIAVPSADGALVRELSALAAEAELAVRILPRVDDLLDGGVNVSDIRPLTDADLLGRHEVDTDIDAIAGYVTGKRVLVTGAGGSIGSELCRQISRFAPAELIMLDRDESALHGVQLSIEGRAMLDTPNLVLCDIRDRTALTRVFDDRRPRSCSTPRPSST
jgi:FlaA1/EpsC-like NDP-sugar epimerase